MRESPTFLLSRVCLGVSFTRGYPTVRWSRLRYRAVLSNPAWYALLHRTPNY